MESDEGSWLISYDAPTAPFFVSSATGENLKRIETPTQFIEIRKRPLSPAEEKRLALIQLLLDDKSCVIDREHRLSIVKEIAVNFKTTTKRVLRIYYRYLARSELGSHPERERKKRPEFDWAIQKYYFSAKRLSLRAAYDMLLVQKFIDGNGQLKADAPSWSSFQHYYYNQEYHKKPEKVSQERA